MSALKQRQYRDCVEPLRCPELKRTLFSVLPHCEWETWFWSEALLFSGTLCQVENQTPLPLGKLESHFLSSESKSYYFQKKPYTLKEGQNYKDLFLYRGKDDNTLLPQKLQKHRLEFFHLEDPGQENLKSPVPQLPSLMTHLWWEWRQGNRDLPHPYRPSTKLSGNERSAQPQNSRGG